MSTNPRKNILKLLMILVMIFSVSTTVHALGDYTELVTLPGTTKCDAAGSNCNQTNFETYLPGLVNFAIGIAAVMAFAVITWGGITYATSDAISGKSQGREYIENAIWGLLLVISAWVILNTINPNILKFDLTIPTPPQQTIPGITGVATPAGMTSLNSIDSETGGINTNGSTGTSVSSSIIPQMTSLDQSLKSQGVPWVVTEGYPPTGSHDDPCHSNGTCVDARPTNSSAGNLNVFYTDAKSAGFPGTFYEVSNQTTANNLAGQGVTAKICINPGQQGGAHFHVTSSGNHLTCIN